MPSATPGVSPSARARSEAAAPRDLVGRFFISGGWLLLLTILGAVLRTYRLGANSLWVDEFATLKIVSLPFSEILGAAARVNFCPPLYFWLVHGVISTAGVSESSLRLVSAIAGTLTIPVAWLLARELTKRRAVAGMCAALLALSPLHIWYSQEARQYAFLVWLASAGLLFFLLAARTNALRYWVGFVGCMTAVMLTHTMGPVLFAVAWGWALLSHRRAAIVRPLFIATVTIGLISLPFAATVAGAVAHATNTHSPPRPLTGLEFPYTLLTYIGGYSFGPSMREIQNLGALAAVGRHPLETAVGVATVVGLLLLVVLRRATGWKYFATLFLVPILAMLLGSATSGKAYEVRYAIAGLLGFCGLIASALRLLPSKIRNAATVALLALFLWADVQWYVTPAYRKDDSRAAVGWLAGHLPPGSSVAVAPPYVAGVLSYYARLQDAPVRFIPAEPPADSVSPAALLLTRLHHVPHQEVVREAFRQEAGPALRTDSVGGYEILSKTGGPGKRPGD